MYLHLHDGPAPLNTAENPLAPGAKPYSYETGYPTMGQAASSIVLPNDLYQQNTQGYVSALNQVLDILNQIKSGRRKDPAKDVSTTYGGPTAYSQTLAGFWVSVLQYLPALIAGGAAVWQGVSGSAINAQVSSLWASNSYNIQNLLTMTRGQVAENIQRIDMDLSSALSQNNRQRAAALGQFRLVFQRRYDELTRFGGVLGGWAVPALIGLAALYFIRRK
jgi:hypothetical protein